MSARSAPSRPASVSPSPSSLCALEILEPSGSCASARESDRSGRLRGLRHLAWLQTRADRDVRAAAASLAHYTNGVAPLRSRTPFVLSIVDLSLLRRPGEHPLGRLVLAPFVVSAARRARLVIVPSRATALEVRRLLHVPADRVVVIPLAARTGAGRAGAGSGVSGETLDRLGLEPGRFVLSLATIEPRKNHVRLLAAFERLAATDPGLRLVLTGRWGWRTSGFRRALTASPHRDRVVVTGHLPDVEVAALLRIMRGDGLSVALRGLRPAGPRGDGGRGTGRDLDGLGACRRPPVARRSSSTRTTSGRSPPGSSEAMDRRDELIAAGLARVAGRSWLDVGRETLDVYRRALET